jgi:hypothetical protein
VTRIALAGTSKVSVFEPKKAEAEEIKKFRTEIKASRCSLAHYVYLTSRYNRAGVARCTMNCAGVLVLG